MNNLMLLLEEREANSSPVEYNKFNEMRKGIYDSELLKADKNASLFDFIQMIDKIVTLTMRDLNVKFIPDEGKVIKINTNNVSLDSPMITYKLVDRKAKGELKPRIRETISRKDEYGDTQFGEIYGQKFTCHIQFNIHASSYILAESVMEKFEELMIIYAGYFKKNGVAELIFDKQFTDDNFEEARQTLSIRNLRYYVEIEKLTVIMRESIKAIETYQEDNES